MFIDFRIFRKRGREEGKDRERERSEERQRNIHVREKH